MGCRTQATRRSTCQCGAATSSTPPRVRCSWRHRMPRRSTNATTCLVASRVRVCARWQTLCDTNSVCWRGPWRGWMQPVRSDARRRRGRRQASSAPLRPGRGPPNFVGGARRVAVCRAPAAPADRHAAGDRGVRVVLRRGVRVSMKHFEASISRPNRIMYDLVFLFSRSSRNFRFIYDCRSKMLFDFLTRGAIASTCPWSRMVVLARDA